MKKIKKKLRGGWFCSRGAATRGGVGLFRGVPATGSRFSGLLVAYLVRGEYHIPVYDPGSVQRSVHNRNGRIEGVQTEKAKISGRCPQMFAFALLLDRGSPSRALYFPRASHPLRILFRSFSIPFQSLSDLPRCLFPCLLRVVSFSDI